MSDVKHNPLVKDPTKLKTAGEVRFIKDKSNTNQWAWDEKGVQERRITPDYAFDPKNVKALACTLRATSMALGHSMSGYSQFTKIKSSTVSPDGNLGGKGYILKIKDMRQLYMNAIEALSALSDTIYDEVRAPHWAAISRQETPEEQNEVAEIVEDATGIREDPEEFAREEESEMDEENQKSRKTASSEVQTPDLPLMSEKIARQFLGHTASRDRSASRVAKMFEETHGR